MQLHGCLTQIIASTFSSNNIALISSHEIITRSIALSKVIRDVYTHTHTHTHAHAHTHTYLYIINIARING